MSILHQDRARIGARSLIDPRFCDMSWIQMYSFIDYRILFLFYIKRPTKIKTLPASTHGADRDSDQQMMGFSQCIGTKKKIGPSLLREDERQLPKSTTTGFAVDNYECPCANWWLRRSAIRATLQMFSCSFRTTVWVGSSAFSPYTNWMIELVEFRTVLS